MTAPVSRLARHRSVPISALPPAPAAPGAGAVDILSLLKHPLSAGGISRAEFRANARALERTVWRDDRHQRQARTPG